MSAEINSFIPMDRRQALVHGRAIPDRASGAALFADISGFTPLTEALAAALSPQRGAEELSALLDQVYTALTAELDRYSGSVIGFSGDAITCWFDQDDGLRAITCATELQSVMRPFATLALAGGVQAQLGIKVAVSIGPARRFLVGDPAIRRIEVLAGATIDRLAIAERQARRGEIVLVAEDAERLTGKLEIAELRVAEESGIRVAVLGQVLTPTSTAPWPTLADHVITIDTARPWLLPAVYERLRGLHGLFVNELRPAVALFIGFGDLDYDTDDQSGQRLDEYICWVQRVLARYEGVLLDITMGDKGGYLYATFGLPQAHPDDAARAAEAAIEIRHLPARLAAITRTQIGIAGGQVRSGIYGGSTRTYGALGEQVNLAARLMQAAAHNQILISARLTPIVERRCVLQVLPPIGVKGRRAPVAVAAIAGVRAINSAQLAEPHYTLPMVGREQQISEILSSLDHSLSGHGRIVSVVGEAGLGKSRLVAEVIRQAMQAGVACHIGEAPSYSMSVTYLAWRPIWRDFFGLSGDLAVPNQVQQLARSLESLGPGIVARMPLLSPLLDLPLADNELTMNLDAQVRKEALETLLIDCLQSRGLRHPLLLVLEDAHWLDPLSIDLLAAVARIVPDLPLLLLLAYRPAELSAATISPIQQATLGAQLIQLSELDQHDATRLMTLKLAALFGNQAILAPELVARILARAQGNPFYIEELLNYLKDYGIAPGDAPAIARLDLPESLAQLLLGRVDRLSSDQQTTLKVASIIGRLFPANWLRGVYPELGSEDRIRHNLEALAHLELTPLHSDQPELNYLFKHVITQEVIYESLPFRLREQLHEQLADWLEQTLASNPPLDILAFHYSRTSNRTKQREYYRRAAAAAGLNYANSAAIHYYTDLLALVEPEQQPEIALELGQILDRIGERQAAEQQYRAALAMLQSPAPLHAAALVLLGGLLWSNGRFVEATQQLEQARAAYQSANDLAGQVRTLCEMVAMYRIQGLLTQGFELLAEARTYAEQLGDVAGLAQILHLYGTLTFTAGDYTGAQQWFLQAIELRRQQGNRFAMAALQNNLGMVLLKLGESDQSLRYVQDALAIFDTLGDRRRASIARMTLGRVSGQRGETQQAQQLFKQSIATFDSLGVQWEIATAAVGLASATWSEAAPLDQLERAIRICAISDQLLSAVGASLQYNDRETLNSVLAAGRVRLGEDVTSAIWEVARAWPRRDALAFLLG